MALNVGDIVRYYFPGAKCHGEIMTVVKLNTHYEGGEERHNVRMSNGDIAGILVSQLEFVSKGNVNNLKEVADRARAQRSSNLGEESYTEDELEFMKAIDTYKKEHRRPFPSITEVLAIAKSLGYRKP